MGPTPMVTSASLPGRGSWVLVVRRAALGRRYLSGNRGSFGGGLTRKHSRTERTSIMTTLDQTARRYLQSWNELDAKARRAAIDELFAETCTYTDPMATVRGPAGVDGFIAAVQQQFAGVRFELAGKVDTHHDV